MTEKYKQIRVKLEWRKTVRCEEIISINIPDWVKGTDEEIYDKYRDQLLCSPESEIEAPSNCTGDWEDEWEPDLESDSHTTDEPTNRHAITADWVKFERPAADDGEEDTFDPELAGQRSLLDLLDGGK